MRDKIHRGKHKKKNSRYQQDYRGENSSYTQRNQRKMSRRKRQIRKRILFLVGEVILLWVLITFGVIKIMEFTNKKEMTIQQKTVKQLSATEQGKTDSSAEEGYIEKKLQEDALYKGNLILVNGNYKYKEKNMENALVRVFDCKNSCYYVKDKNVLLRREVITAFNCMLEDFCQITDNKQVMVVSGYRDQEYQGKLYQENLQQTGRYYSDTVTRPGHSEHHTGYSLDLGIYAPGRDQSYDGKGIYKWINENSWKYGFIVRYPEGKKESTYIDYEPWHFRYVGIPHAQIMYENHWCLEEYLSHLKKYTIGKEHYKFTSYDKKKYEIYFVEGKKLKTVPVPENKDYWISGNNVDGYIITIEG